MANFILILFSILVVSSLVAIILYLCRALFEKIWDIEELTGFFWKGLDFLIKGLFSLTLVLIPIDMFFGLIYIIKLIFNAIG